MTATAAESTARICEGETIVLQVTDVPGAVYYWSGPNDFTSSSQNPSIGEASLAMSGEYTVLISLNDCTSSIATTSIIINEHPATPTILYNGPVCVGDSLLLSTPGSFNASYTWTGPNGFFSTEQNPMVSSFSETSMAGVYMLTATVNNCTSAEAETWVDVNAIPATPAVSNNGPVCESSVLSLEAEFISEASYAWAGPNGFTSGEQNPVISSNATVDLSGSYSVVATLGDCSSMAAETSVIVHPIPEAPVALSNGPVNEGAELVLTATPVPEATYTWTGPNGFTSNEQNPVVSLEATLAMAGIYEVGITVNACESDVASLLVVVDVANSIQHQSSLIGVHAYPNPASEKLWIEVSDLLFNSVQLVNSLGTVITQSTLSYPTTQLNIHDFASGVYYLILRGEGKREEVRLIKY